MKAAISLIYKDNYWKVRKSILPDVGKQNTFEFRKRPCLYIGHISMK